MAQETVVVRAEVQGGESVGSLKKQLREAQKEVEVLSEKFGATSEQAVAAAKKAAELKDAIGDARALTDAFNPDAKFQAFGSALQGVAGGFSAVQGAIGLLGVESQEVEKTLLKVQSAMALSQGINSLMGAKDAFANLKTVAVDAFKSIKTAIGSTGIGALLLAVGALVVYWEDIKEAVTGVSAEQKKALKTATDAVKQSSKQLEDFKLQENSLRLQGKSEKEILQLRIARQKTNLQDLRNQLEAQKQTAKFQIEAEERNYKIINGILEFTTAGLQILFDGINLIGKAFGKDFDLDASQLITNTVFDPEAVKKKTQETLAELDKNIKQLESEVAGGELELKKIEQQAADERRKAAESNAEKRRQLEEQEAEKRKEAAEKLAQLEKENLIEIRKLQTENYLATIKDESERTKKKLELDFKARKAEIDALVIDEAIKGQRLTQERIKYERELNAIIEKQEADRKKKEDDKRKEELDRFRTNLENEKQRNLERQNAIREATSTNEENELFNLQQQYAKRLQLVKGNEEAEASLVEQFERQKASVKKKYADETLSATANILGQATALFGKQTAAGKATAVAEATINTYLAASKALTGIVKGNPLSAGLAIAQAAIIVATGLKNVREIIKTKVPGDGGGNPNTPAPNLSTFAPISPQSPQAQITQLDQQTINSLGSATNRAYVVETDITNSQERISRINRAARLN